METGKVSVIVPVYKVEKYIHRCLHSIIRQTYSNLEIILVDDGSPDNCGQIVDDYQAKDPRIKVIHKENGGLSDARNHGMQAATGEYTMFVDSDDWLESEMVETMMAWMAKKGADVVQSAFYYAYEDMLLLDQRYFTEKDAPVTLHNSQLMYELVVNEKMKNFAWGKLYKTALVRDIPFRKGVLFEDVFWAHHVMKRVNTCIMLHQPFYYYYQRDDSIVAAYTRKHLDMIKGLKERHRFIASFYPELLDASYKQLAKTCLIHYNLLVMNRSMDKEGLHRDEIVSYVHTNYKELKKAVRDEKPLRFQLFLFSLHPYCNIGYLGWRKGLRKLKILRKPAGLDQVESSVTKGVMVK